MLVVYRAGKRITIKEKELPLISFLLILAYNSINIRQILILKFKNVLIINMFLEKHVNIYIVDHH